jgi:SpoIID/LytB domain protein
MNSRSFRICRSSRATTLLASVAAVLLGVTAAVVPLVVAAPPAAADTAVTLIGHGFGHGRGMGQWGAQGYARDFGWSADQILDHFYGGTSAGGIDENGGLSVRLIAQDGRDVTVTSVVGFNVPGLGHVDGGRGVRIHWNGSAFETSVAYTNCLGDEVPGYHPIYTGGDIISESPDQGNDINQMLTICNEDGAGNNVSYRGALRFLFDSGAVVHTVNDLLFWQYLRGTVPRESPSSWMPAALRAQAVAARSYAATSNSYPYANICDTTSCQVYGGAGKSGQYIEAASTNNAVAATAGQVRVENGAVQRTEYSASTGGFTAGGAFPAVVDDGDATAGNTSHNWTVNLSTSTISSKYGIGAFQGFLFTSRNGLGDLGGRVISMQIVGSSKTVTRSGAGFEADWGLRSDWFGTPTPPNVLTWNLRNSDSGGPPDLSFAYGTPGDIPVVGDWNNGPQDGIGVYNGGQWNLRNTASPGAPDISFAYGTSAYVPVVGRWNPGQVGIGTFDNGNWYLRPTVTPGPPTAAFAYGSPGDIPVVGDWNNDGIDTIGVYHNGTWNLRNENSPGPPDLVVSYGTSGYVPLVGVWQGNNGGQSLGNFAGGAWYLRNIPSTPPTVTPGPPTIVFNYGDPGNVPVRGNWNGGTIHGVGVVVRP